MEESGRPFTLQYREDTDKLIEEVVYTTQEEFHAYYKARDERYFGLIEGPPSFFGLIKSRQRK